MRQNYLLAAVLAVGLFLAYRIWTEEASPVLASGDFSIWRGEVSEIDSVTYSDRRGYTRIERRVDPEWGDYYWGVAEALEPDTSVFIPSPGFLVGIDGQNVVEGLANLTAIREFGSLTEEQRVEYGFVSDSTATLIVYFSDGPREVTIGGASFGSTDRYALDPVNDRAFILNNELIKLLRGGARDIKERRLHAFSPEDVRTAHLTSSQGEVALVRTAGEFGAENWSFESEPGSANPALTSFMQSYNSLWYSDISNVAQRDLVESVARVDYFGGDGRQLGYLELFRWEGPGGTPLYYIESEVTRNPVEVLYLDTPKAIEAELPNLLR
jgi:hypothetical protein